MNKRKKHKGIHETAAQVGGRFGDIIGEAVGSVFGPDTGFVIILTNGKEVTSINNTGLELGAQLTRDTSLEMCRGLAESALKIAEEGT